MTTSKSVSHAPASSVGVVTNTSSSAIVTVTAGSANKERIWLGTNPATAIYPWMGMPLTAGQTAVIGVLAGQTLYSNSPGGPATLTASY
jgi:hypothetical protein